MRHGPHGSRLLVNLSTMGRSSLKAYIGLSDHCTVWHLWPSLVSLMVAKTPQWGKFAKRSIAVIFSLGNVTQMGVKSDDLRSTVNFKCNVIKIQWKFHKSCPYHRRGARFLRKIIHIGFLITFVIKYCCSGVSGSHMSNAEVWMTKANLWIWVGKAQWDLYLGSHR